jgi:cytochrome c oxidase subunit 3
MSKKKLTEKQKELIKLYFTNQHPFHLVTPSPWPFTTSMAALSLTIGLVMYFHNYSRSYILLFLGIIGLILSLTFWWRDVVREGTFEGRHTKAVQKGLRLGMILFIVSEVMFFFSFFWAFFHSSLVPSIWIGCVWPPKGIEVLNPWMIPLENTLILLLSGATLTWSHYSILTNNRSLAINTLILTIILGLIFTVFQLYEYTTASFTISDGIYGSTFYLTTGFHGFHVIIGTIFLFVCLIRMIFYHFSSRHHLGFEFASWYWHFVDVVWLFLYLTIYIWGGNFL